MKLSNLIFVALMGIFFNFSCKNEVISNYAKIDKFLSTKYHKKINKYDYLIIINEQGNCLNCNNNFSKSVSKHIKSDNVLYIISTQGFNVDISPYVNKNHSNVLFDYDNEFSKLNLVKKCAIIDLGEHKIDTIIQIDAYNISNSINNFNPL